MLAKPSCYHMPLYTVAMTLRIYHFDSVLVVSQEWSWWRSFDSIPLQELIRSISIPVQPAQILKDVSVYKFISFPELHYMHASRGSTNSGELGRYCTCTGQCRQIVKHAATPLNHQSRLPTDKRLKLINS